MHFCYQYFCCNSDIIAFVNLKSTIDFREGIKEFKRTLNNVVGFERTEDVDHPERDEED